MYVTFTCAAAADIVIATSLCVALWQRRTHNKRSVLSFYTYRYSEHVSQDNLNDTHVDDIYYQHRRPHKVRVCTRYFCKCISVLKGRWFSLFAIVALITVKKQLVERWPVMI